MNTQILEEATDWLIELNSGDAGASARQRFDAWLRSSPEHVRAYLELLPAWEAGAALPTRLRLEEKERAQDDGSGADPLGAEDRLTIDALIAMGRDAATSSNVVSLSRESAQAIRAISSESAQPPVARPAEPDAPQVKALKLAFAASLLLVGCVSVGLYLYFTRETYSTAVGEQRIFRLNDGSSVELNSRSKVRIRYSPHQRSVELVEGQALFQVAHDTERPFIVTTDDTQVRAVGTQFDVYRKTISTVVTVLEGKVAIATAAGLQPDAKAARTRDDPIVEGRPLHLRQNELVLGAGEQLTIAPGAVPARRPTDVAKATAWTHQHLVFEAATLRDVVEEFNRYNARQLVLQDQSLEAFPITAAFSSPDPTSLIRFLRAQPDIQVQETPTEILISHR